MAAVSRSRCALVARAAPAPSAAPAPPPSSRTACRTAIASWYGPGFHGRRPRTARSTIRTSSPRRTRRCRSARAPMVTNLDNGRAVEVRINDRGPFVGGRVIDLSLRGGARHRHGRPGHRPRAHRGARARAAAANGAPHAAPRRAGRRARCRRSCRARRSSSRSRALTDPGTAEHLRRVVARASPTPTSIRSTRGRPLPSRPPRTVSATRGRAGARGAREPPRLSGDHHGGGPGTVIA